MTVVESTDEEPRQADDGFAAYAVRTRSGPHVTMQAGVVQSGCFITTTSRDSLKAKSVRAHRVAAATVERDDGATFDDSASRRPDHKRGAMLRGHLDLVEVDGAHATVAIRTDRITAWDGFSASTTDVDDAP